ncbi:MAG: hypothetical protein PHQ27_06220 [Victivallales bacterium]|nr:hypothetical protein [Victivallales bacterium]
MKEISNLAATASAFRHTREILFQPFDIVVWLVLALCAWLSQLGSELGAWGNNLLKSLLRTKFGHNHNFLLKIRAGDYSDLKECVASVENFLSSVNPIWLVLGLMLFLALWLLLLWIRAQAQIVFIDNLVHRSTRFMASFREHFHNGNSIFLWEIVYSMVSPLLMFSVGIMPLLLALPWLKSCIEAKTFLPPGEMAITGMVIAVTLVFFVALLMKLLLFYFYQFIIPIVFIRNCNAFRATAIGAGLFKNHTWTFIKYVILYVVLMLVFSTLLFAIIIATCCLVMLPMMIPYVWAVLLLPVLVFFRLLGLELLNQLYKHQIW